jgi:hypothetical protein
LIVSLEIGSPDKVVCNLSIEITDATQPKGLLLLPSTVFLPHYVLLVLTIDAAK